jgi:hypothetical protein
MKVLTEEIYQLHGIIFFSCLEYVVISHSHLAARCSKWPPALAMHRWSLFKTVRVAFWCFHDCSVWEQHSPWSVAVRVHLVSAFSGERGGQACGPPRPIQQFPLHQLCYFRPNFDGALSCCSHMSNLAWRGTSFKRSGSSSSRKAGSNLLVNVPQERMTQLAGC